VAVDYADIYRNHAAEYDLLVEREDYQGQLDAALFGLSGIDGTIVELAAGTGRLTRRLVGRAAHVSAWDIEPAMLSVARTHLEHIDPGLYHLGVADFREVPIPDDSADLVIEGWGLGHLAAWNESTWRATLGEALAEMERLARSGGTIVLIETLGTGQEEPRAPTPLLTQLYQYLESEGGFESRWLRTDYRFASAEEARRLLELFFGHEMASAWEGFTEIPECTGLWWKRR
jgi:ubiquinone/menaquinone biosynthesis C-methylase UbiE